MIEFASHSQQGRLVWDTHSLAEQLQAKDIANNRKGTDRWLEQQAMLPAPVSHGDIYDELQKPLKPQVVEQLLTTAKKRRHNILYVQAFVYQDQHGLFANDAKGSRRWLWNDQAWNIDSLREALIALVGYNKKDTLFFPHGEVTSLCRQLWLTDKQQAVSNDDHKGLLAMAAYAGKLHINQTNLRPTHIADGNSHLERLEAESIHIMREVLAQAENPVMLYSVGKDSAVMLHLARKAFYPAHHHSHCCMWILAGSSKKCISFATRWPKKQVWS